MSPPAPVSGAKGPAPRTRTLALLVVAVLTGVMRLPYAGGPFTIDEYAYFVLGREVAAGELPLDTAWLNRSPVGALIYAIPASLPFGPDRSLVLFAWLLSAATGYLLFLLLHRRVGERWAWFGSILFCFLSADPATQANGANMEMPINLFVTWSIVVAFGAPERARLWTFLTAGSLLGVAVAQKEPMLVFWLPIAVAAWERHGLRERLSAAAVALAGAAIPWGLAFAVYGFLGKVKLLTAVWSFQASYSVLKPLDLAGGPIPLLAERGFALFALWPLVILAFWWLAELPWRRGFPLAVGFWILSAGLVVTLPCKFFPHYYLILIPPLAVCAPLWLSEKQEERGGPLRAYALALMLLIWVLGVEWRMAAGHRPLAVWRIAAVRAEDRYFSRLGWAIRTQASPRDRLFVVGRWPTLYAKSGLRPATPDFWGLTTGQQIDQWNWSGKRDLLDRVVRVLSVDPPEWIVVAEPPGESEVDRAVLALLTSRYRESGLGSISIEGDDVTPARVFRLRSDESEEIHD